MPHRHIPALSPAELEIALQELEATPLPLGTKQQLRLILIAASNPNSESVEASIASLPADRQQVIFDILQRVEAHQRRVAERGAAAALLLGLLGAASFVLALVDHFAMQENEIALLADQLFTVRQSIWRNAITDEAHANSLSVQGRFPSGTDLETLRRMSNEDAINIANTYNRDLERRINKLRKENPSGDLQYFVDNLRLWAIERAAWKAAQIALNTETNTREFARLRFWQENGLTDRRFIATGSPPTCEICIAIFGAGIVDFAYTQRHPLPAHPNCPHWYKLYRKARLNDATAWVG